MSPNTPKILKAGLIRLDPDNGNVIAVVPLQYNPDSISRSLSPHGASADGDHMEALRLTGPPTETLTIEAEIDATDSLETATNESEIIKSGIAPQLAILETMLYPALSALNNHNSQASQGLIEVLPAAQPVTLFVWSRNRVTPIRITDFSITEEAFDTNLNPIRAKVSLTMRVLTVDDLGFSGKAASLYLTYQQRKEILATKYGSGALADLGLEGVL